LREIDTVRFRDRMTSLLQRFGATRSGKGQRLLTKDEQNILHDMETTIEQATAPLQQLEHALMPMVTFVVLPVFALANAGLTVSGGLTPLVDPVGLGIVAGLLLGKPLGVVGLSWVAVRLRLAELPAGADWRGLLAVGLLTGVGFTMSLFVAGLAFSEPARIEVAKTGILSASFAATLIGLAACHLAFPRSAK
jgi:NhaA family Na+:H+ antiporter